MLADPFVFSCFHMERTSPLLQQSQAQTRQSQGSRFVFVAVAKNDRSI